MKKQSGYTLIEIMIALLLGLIVIAATITIYITTIKGSSDTLKSARLNHDLESAMSLMVNDIRRAGYWGGAVVGADSKNNPFTVTTTTATNFAPSNIAVMDFTDSGGTLHPNGCILYSYDADVDGHYDDNNNGIFDSPSDDTTEFYGFKLDGNTIKMRFTGTTTANCKDGYWEAMTINSGGENIKITGLTFSTAYKCLNVSTALPYPMTCAEAVTAGNLAMGHKAVESRQISIILTGSLASEPTVTKKLTSTVKVRNDRIFTQP